MDAEQWKSKEVARLLALVETERRYYQEMVGTLPVSIAVADRDGFLVAANRSFRQHYQVYREELRKRRIEQVFPSPELKARIAATLESGIPSQPIVIAYASGSGKIHNLRIRVQPIRDWDEETELQVLLVVEDLTEPAEAAAPVALASTQPAISATNLPCVLWTARAEDRTFLDLSASIATLFGIDPVQWMGVQTAFSGRIHVDDRERVLAFYDQMLKLPGTHSCEFRLESKPEIWCRETVRVEAGQPVTGVMIDVTARRTMEEQNLQSQRVDALAVFGRRLSHDLNNALAIVSGYAEELSASLPASDPRSSDMREMLAGVRRIEALSEHLQKLSRKPALQTGRVDLGVEIAKAVGRMRSTSGEYLQIEYKEPAEPVAAWADAEQFEEAIIRLTSSLVEGSGDKARLAVSVEAIQISESIRADQPLPPGDYAEVSIVSRSPGYRHANPRVFESPLPGKEAQDSGFALTRIYRAVEDLGGIIHRSADAGEIRMYLKLAPQQKQDTQAGRTAPATDQTLAAPAVAPASRRTTILLVDDDNGLRALTRKILQREGYEVFEASNGQEALEFLKKGGPVELLITDTIMPGMSGRELALQANALMPDLGVLHVSGYTGDTRVETGQYPPGSHFLQKPFTVGSLLRKVKEVLESRSRSASA